MHVDPSDSEREALERGPLASPGPREDKLLKALDFEVVHFIMALAHHDAWVIEEGEEGAPLLAYRSVESANADKKIHRVPLPVTDEALRPIVERGSRNYAVCDLNYLVHVAEWLPKALVLCGASYEDIERRLKDAAEFREVAPAARYLREALLSDDEEERLAYAAASREEVDLRLRAAESFVRWKTNKKTAAIMGEAR